MKANTNAATCSRQEESKMDNKKSKKNSKNNKKNNNQRRTSGATFGERIPKTNDPSWYTSNAKLVEASARIPFPYRPGISVPTYAKNTNTGIKSTFVSATAKIPGVFAIDWVPAVGVSSDVTSPISLAARDIFSKVRSAFSGSIQADAPDFIIHMMAMDSIYSYISYLKRMYKTLITFNPDNQITPEVLLQTMGWSSSDIYKLMSQKVEFFGVINELVAMTNRFFTPNIMPVMQRHVWMSERVYSDAPSVNSQMYLFNLTHVYKFSTDSNGAGQLTLVPVPHSGTVSDLFTFGRELIQAVSDWDDGYIINGYLAKAYDTAARFAISPLNLDDRLEMVYNEVVLSQIENATCAPTGLSAVSGSITQNANSNALIATYSGTIPNASKGKGHVWTTNRINCRGEQPSAVDTIEASRLMTKWSAASGTATVEECGTEVVTNFRILTYDTSSNAWNPVTVNNMVIICTQPTQAVVNMTTTELSSFVYALVAFSAFDWHPIMLTGSEIRSGTGSDISSVDYIGLLGDIHNITFISDEDMAHINRCCLYSEFGSFGD